MSTYAHLPPKSRPATTCPVCGRRVVLKLGARVAHHAAHAPGDPCAVTRPETALHFNLKCHLAAELERAAGAGLPLRVTEACLVGQSGLRGERRYDTPPPDGYLREEWLADPCPERRDRVWLPAWDRVELERRVGDAHASRVPDVVLFLRGAVVGAVEVFHSHAVDAAKAAALAAWGVPWVEVRADAALLAPGAAWTVDAALPAHRVGPARRWRCAAHRAHYAAAREAARHTTRVCAVRLVDVLFPDGDRRRRVFRVVEHRTDDVPHRLTLERGETVLLDLALGSAPKRDLWARVRARVDADVRAAEAQPGVRTDSPMGWARGKLAALMAERAEGWYGGWSRPPLEETHPPRWRFVRATGTWFQPRDLRNVDWTRPEHDDLEEPHPAWYRPIPRRAPGSAPGPAARQTSARQPSVLQPSRSDQSGPIAGRAADGAAGTAEQPNAGSRAERARPDAPSDAPVPARIRPAPATAPVTAADFGPACRTTRSHAGVATCALAGAGAGAGADGRPAVLVVPEPGASPAAVRTLDRRLAQAGVERLWVSRAEEWSRALDDVPWLPVLRGSDGVLGVVLRDHRISLPVLAAWLAAGTAELDARRVLAERRAAALPEDATHGTPLAAR